MIWLLLGAWIVVGLALVFTDRTPRREDWD